VKDWEIHDRREEGTAGATSSFEEAAEENLQQNDNVLFRFIIFYILL
jgi:hypothetical protein